MRVQGIEWEKEESVQTVCVNVCLLCSRKRHRANNSHAAVKDCHLCADNTQEKKQQQRSDEAWYEERKEYGKTAEGTYIEQESHSRLVGLGYDR